MPRPRDDARRDELLAAVVATCADRGLGQRSLRDIAEAAGTSHRMLIHHFGSREGLMVAVVRDVEARQAAIAAGLDGPPGEIVDRMWDHLSDPAVRPFERLFFECYARAANGEQPFATLLPEAVDSWLTGDLRHPDAALTRLGLAVVRGLLLDLVATDAREETTAAMRRFTALLGDAARHRGPP